MVIGGAAIREILKNARHWHAAADCRSAPAVADLVFNATRQIFQSKSYPWALNGRPVQMPMVRCKAALEPVGPRQKIVNFDTQPEIVFDGERMADGAWP